MPTNWPTNWPTQPSGRPSGRHNQVADQVADTMAQHMADQMADQLADTTKWPQSAFLFLFETPGGLSATVALSVEPFKQSSDKSPASPKFRSWMPKSTNNRIEAQKRLHTVTANNADLYTAKKDELARSIKLKKVEPRLHGRHQGWIVRHARCNICFRDVSFREEGYPYCLDGSII